MRLFNYSLSFLINHPMRFYWRNFMEKLLVMNQILIILMLGFCAFLLVKNKSNKKTVQTKTSLEKIYDTLNSAINKKQGKLLIDGEAMSFADYRNFYKALSHYEIPFDYNDQKDLFLIHLDRYSGPGSLPVKIFKEEKEDYQQPSIVQNFRNNDIPPKLMNDIFGSNVVPFKKKEEVKSNVTDGSNIIHIDFSSRKRKA